MPIILFLFFIFHSLFFYSAEFIILLKFCVVVAVLAVRMRALVCLFAFHVYL